MRNEMHDTEQLLGLDRRPMGPKVIAGICALIVTSLFFLGYAYLRNRHVQQTSVKPLESAMVPAVPMGSPVASVLVDEAMLKGGETIIGGTVKNISDSPLLGVIVELELYPRRGTSLEETQVRLEPANLDPQQEGHYTLKLNAKDYSSVRLLGLRAGAESNLIAFTSGVGRKRPPERINGEVVPASRPRNGREEFLNSPENPARVP